jgi:transcription antitermination factor NusG
MESKKNWYAVYTKPRWEKKVHATLSARGMESYCPLNKVRKQWSDRIKLVEEPLFKSYVFVHVPEEEQSHVRMVDGVLNYVYWQGKPAIVKDREIEDIRRFLNEYQDVQLMALDFQPESRVLIRSGVLMDKEAIVQRVLHQTVEVVIESLGYKLVAQIDKSNLVPLT